MNNLKITPRETDVVNFIKDFREDFGYSPTFREIADGLYLNSIYPIEFHVGHLVEKGVLQITPKTARSLQVLK